MTTVSADVQERLRRIRVDEYHRMMEAGILGEDERVQLIEGILVAVTPQGRPHARVIQELNRLLVKRLADDYRVLTQLPLTLAGDSEPEPDLAVVRAEEAVSATRHPTSAVLVIEVADESLRFDRRTKASLYARSGIPEYWIVNLVDRVIEVHRNPDPDSGGYREVSVSRSGDTLSARAVDGIRVDVTELIQ